MTRTHARPISVQVWRDEATWDEVCRLLGGRRKYNAHRAFMARLRRQSVARLIAVLGYRHGSQRRVASLLGVSESTISRDLAALWRCPPT